MRPAGSFRSRQTMETTYKFGNDINWKYMKAILVPISSLLLTVAATGQTPQPGKISSAERSDTQPQSNRELNTQAYIDLLRHDVRKEKSQIMGQIMQLDAEESARFWPIYKSFETELTAIGDDILALVQNYVSNYQSMTD